MAPCQNLVFCCGLLWTGIILVAGIEIKTHRIFTFRKPSMIKCNVPMDIVFALDSSGSIGAANWQQEIDYVERLIRLLEISAKSTRVGVVDFSTFAKVRLTLFRGINIESVLEDLEDAREQYKGDLTSTERALERAVDMFAEDFYHRQVPRILVVVTDGKTTWKDGKSGSILLGKPVSDLQQMNVTVYAVGVGPLVNDEELRFITRDQTGSKVIRIERFNDLVLSINNILQPYCGAPPTETPQVKSTAKPKECDMKLHRVGCYYDSQRDPRPLPEYILNDRDPSLPGFSGKVIDWKNWNTYLPDFICRCARKAYAMRRKIIGLQYYGECYTSADPTSYNKDGPRNTEKDCITLDYKACTDDASYCIGARYHNFVYFIVG